MGKNLVPIARFVDLNEAHIARGFLLTNDIAAVLHDTNLVSIGLPAAQAVSGIKLMVPATDADRASLLLREVTRGDFAMSAEEIDPREPAEELAIDHCPRCNGEDIDRSRSFFGALLSWMLAAPLTAGSRRHYCRSCGQEWDSA